jgi:hypothetical protein
VECLDDAIRRVAVATGTRNFRKLAERAADELGADAIDSLVSRLHAEATPPDELAKQFPGLGEWMAARQCAIFEILELMGEPALPVLRRIAHGEYDWTQANAIEVLCRLAARGIETERIGDEIATLLPTLRDEAIDYAMPPLIARAKHDARLREFLLRHASFDEPVRVGAAGQLDVFGLAAGRRVQRTVRTLEEAAHVIAGAASIAPNERDSVLFEFWARQRKPERPHAEVASALLALWRERLEAHTREPPPARNEEFERSERWIRLAELGLLLPMTTADVTRLRAAATVGPFMQSTAWKRLEKVSGA